MVLSLHRTSDSVCKFKISVFGSETPVISVLAEYFDEIRLLKVYPTPSLSTIRTIQTLNTPAVGETLRENTS